MVKKLADSIRSRRKALGLTIEELAERADVGTNYLGLIERGRQTPSIDKTYDIAAALRCTVDDLYQGSTDTGIEFLFDGINSLDEESYFSLIKVIQVFQDYTLVRKERPSAIAYRSLEGFGSEIRKRRNRQGLTIDKLAEKAGIGDNYVSRIERGLQSPSIVIAAKLSEALGCTLNDLCYTGKPPELASLMKGMESWSPETHAAFVQLVQVFIDYSKN